MHEWEKRRRPFHDHHNFWHDWRAEQLREHMFMHGMSTDSEPCDHEGAGDAWREFFHNFTGNWPEDHWIFGGRRFSPWVQGMDSFNPFLANLLSKGGGLLPLYVLHLLSQKARYGNEIMDILSKQTDGNWVSNPGAIYPLLALLESKGFIEGKWEDPQKRTVRIYNITQSGQDELTRLKAIMIPKLTETMKILDILLNDLIGDQVNPDDSINPKATEE